MKWASATSPRRAPVRGGGGLQTGHTSKSGNANQRGPTVRNVTLQGWQQQTLAKEPEREIDLVNVLLF